ncbi:MAG: AbrB/MazE/SpoVT family DNA-binding domain-containing protein [Candidatus Methanodesulfokora sp.]|jgi:AbrB family looped-hinge helix DNA binding protein|nr:MAG: AbrB family transcriptional regulator [Candidatus Korarchaeota archaeon]
MEIARIDEKGRLLIPKKLRREAGVQEGGFVRLTVRGNCIIIEPVKPAEQFFEAFKVKEWPEDLDKFVIMVMRDW